MAIIRGQSSKNRELIAVIWPTAVTKNGKSQYIDVQLREDPTQVSAHLVSHKGDDGRYNNNAPYSIDQVNAMREAAGKNVVTLNPGPKSTVAPDVIAFRADLMVRNNGLIVNTKTVKPSEKEPIGKDILAKQYATMRRAKAAKEATTAAPQAPAQAAAPAPAPQVEDAGPDFD